MGSTPTRPRSPSELASWWAGWLWDETPAQSRLERTLRVAARFTYALVRDLLGGELGLRAASLVYTTILSVVPLLALSFSVLKGLGVHRRLEPLLENFLAPLGPQAPQLAERVIGFVDNVEGSVLAGVSLGLLLVTTISLAQKVESSFNFVWRIATPRSIARRISDYLSLVLAGPIVVSVLIGLLATLTDTGLLARVSALEPFGTLLVAFGQIVPYLVMIAVFAFVYAFVPNTRVRLGPALAGGLFGGSLWAGSGYVFAAFVGVSARTQAIYSGFATVIAAMVWLYLSWLMLLLGAQLAFYCQNPFALRPNAARGAAGALADERLAIAAMLAIGRRYAEGSPAPTPDGLAASLRVPRHVLEPVLDALVRTRLAERSERGTFLPGRDAHRIGLAEIVTAARRPRAADGYTPPAENEVLSTLSAQIESGIRNALGERTLADLLEQDGELPTERPEAPASAPRA